MHTHTISECAKICSFANVAITGLLVDTSTMAKVATTITMTTVTNDGGNCDKDDVIFENIHVANDRDTNH